MWKRSFAFGAVIAVAALLLAADAANAQRRWGVGVGGGGVGVYYGSGYRSGYGYPGYWNYGSGWYPYSYGAYPYGSGFGVTIGSQPYYSYPYSSWGSGYPSYRYGYRDSGFRYGTTYYSEPTYYSSGPSMPGYQSFYGSSPQASFTPPANSVMVDVRVPDPNAELWFGDTKTTMTGAERSFVSPSLTPGQDYTYTLRARWMEAGEAKDRTKTVDVRPGQRVTVDFTRADAEKVGQPRSDVAPKPSPDVRQDLGRPRPEPRDDLSRPRPDKPAEPPKPRPSSPEPIKD